MAAPHLGDLLIYCYLQNVSDMQKTVKCLLSFTTVSAIRATNRLRLAA
jgi:hypothetical protein